MKQSLAIGICAIGLAAMTAGALADDYASKNGWRFHNFSDPTLSWDIYRDTFIGIPASEDPVASPFDALFYEQVYKSKLAAPGNCFGMSLLSLMILQNGGHLGYCAPVTQYSGDPNATAMGPSDPLLHRAINVMHGHQVNLPTLQFLLDVFAQHKNRDAQYAYDQFNYWQSRGDLTLVSITQDLNPADNGHTLVAYRAQDLGGGNKKIFVVDPNRTWGNSTDQGWYNAENNFIQINGNAWSFVMASGIGTWSGDPGSGGNLVIIPISITGPHARSPASLGDTIIGQLRNTLLLTGANANIEQVTDASGKRLYKPGTFELDTDPATGMMNTLPWIASDQGAGNAPKSVMLFQMGPSGGALQVSIRAGAGDYTLRSMGGRTMVAVTEHGGSGSSVLTIRNPGTAETGVVIDNRGGAWSYDVQFTHAEIPGQRARTLIAAQLRPSGAGAIEVGLANQARGLRVASATTALKYNLQFASMTRQEQNVLAKTEVAQDAGVARSARPGDWRNLKDALVQEQVQAVGARRALQ
jgi:hypothetical protein